MTYALVSKRLYVMTVRDAHIQEITNMNSNTLFATDEIYRFQPGPCSLHGFCVWYYSYKENLR
jgi:hypothetical protein